MNFEEVNQFEWTEAQLQGLHAEISVLSKSKPNELINKFKLKLINTVLSSANEILGDDYCPFPDFQLFEEDALPSYSDVIVMLTQYLNSFEMFRADNTATKKNQMAWYWVIDGEMSDRNTRKPKRF